MTDQMDVHRQAFRAEAEELLAELETSLIEWEQDPDDRELIGRIFRAMHTIKGSGAMFGFDDVAAFTHEVETVLDLVRQGLIRPTRELIDLTLAARDLIKVMIEAADGGPPAESGRSARLVAAFQSWQNPGRPKEVASDQPQPQSDLRTSDLPEVTYRIRFRPHQDLFLKGTNPTLLLKELGGLGQSRTVAQLEAIPTLEQYDPETCYTFWDIILTTGLGIDAIKDVFIFVEDDCELSIEVIDDGGRFDLESGYQRLGELLVERGDLNPKDLQVILDNKPVIGELLVEAGVVTPGRVEAALVEQKHVQEIRERREKAAEVTTIRVPSDRLDKLVDLVGEMVTVQARLSQLSGGRKDADLVAIAEEVERLTGELRDNAMSTRMVPIGTLFSKFGRLVRDLSHELGKDIEMVTSGAETELDKTVIERLNDPLVHLIRNSIDHGIEPPEIRAAAGKMARGLVHVSAEHSGANVYIHIEDDGAGLDVGLIKAKAVEKGLISADFELGEQEAFNLIFAPGFSTATKITGVSGRGVGMDVVKRNIEALKGTVNITSQKGQGTRVTLRLPLTLAIIDGLLVDVGRNHFVVPVSIIEECVELTARDAAQAHGRTTVTVRRELVPYIRLRDRFGINGGRPEIEQVVIGRAHGQRVGLVVDRVIGHHQTVIKSLGPMFKQVTDISGATILGNGTVALILDMPNLIQSTETQTGWARNTDHALGKAGGNERGVSRLTG